MKGGRTHSKGTRPILHQSEEPPYVLPPKRRPIRPRPPGEDPPELPTNNGEIEGAPPADPFIVQLLEAADSAGREDGEGGEMKMNALEVEAARRVATGDGKRTKAPALGPKRVGPPPKKSLLGEIMQERGASVKIEIEQPKMKFNKHVQPIMTNPSHPIFGTFAHGLAACEGEVPGRRRESLTEFLSPLVFCLYCERRRPCQCGFLKDVAAETKQAAERLRVEALKRCKKVPVKDELNQPADRASLYLAQAAPIDRGQPARKLTKRHLDGITKPHSLSTCVPQSAPEVVAAVLPAPARSNPQRAKAQVPKENKPAPQDLEVVDNLPEARVGKTGEVARRFFRDSEGWKSQDAPQATTDDSAGQAGSEPTSPEVGANAAAQFGKDPPTPQAPSRHQLASPESRPFTPELGSPNRSNISTPTKSLGAQDSCGRWQWASLGQRAPSEWSRSRGVTRGRAPGSGASRGQWENVELEYEPLKDKFRARLKTIQVCPLNLPAAQFRVVAVDPQLESE